MTTKQATALATVRATELHRVLCDAAVFASHDETIPPINAVHLEFGNNLVLAVATDRFRLGVSKIGPVDGTLPSGGTVDAEATFNLSLHDVTSLIKLSKTLRRDERTRVVWISQSVDGTVTFKFNDGASLNVTSTDAEFPKWRMLFPDTGSQVPRDATAFTAEYLASFGKVDGGDGQRLVMYSFDDIHGYDQETQKSQKPTTFTIGENFVGLLMPVKLPGDDSRTWVKPEWM